MRMLAAILIFAATVMAASSPAHARGWRWFVDNIRPGHACPGSPIATTMYGDGRHNADGSRFNPSGHSAASWDYPFGTVLRVTNCSNGHSVSVTVKDRGPARYQRSLGIKLDLSVGAARAIRLGQNGRFESGYTSVEVVSVGGGDTFGRRHRHRGRHLRRIVVRNVAKSAAAF